MKALHCKDVYVHVCVFISVLILTKGIARNRMDNSHVQNTFYWLVLIMYIYIFTYIHTALVMMGRFMLIPHREAILVIRPVV